MDVLKELFEQHFHTIAERVVPIQGQLGSSGRNIIRLSNDRTTAIGVVYGVREENVAFLEFSKHFYRQGLPVPEIYAEDLARDAYLEEDLGDTTLFEFLSVNRAGDAIAPNVIQAYRNTVATLPRFQIEAGRDLDYSVCYPRDSFDRQSIAWDLNYLKLFCENERLRRTTPCVPVFTVHFVPENISRFPNSVSRLSFELLFCAPPALNVSSTLIAMSVVCGVSRFVSWLYWNRTSWTNFVLSTALSRTWTSALCAMRSEARSSSVKLAFWPRP